MAEGPSTSCERAARARQQRLTKPPGSLGRLEELACWFAARLEDPAPEMPRAEIFVFAADHGVVAQGVSAYPREVTRQMLANFASGGAAINVLARLGGAELRVIDVGAALEGDAGASAKESDARRGTRDLSLGPAMTRDEAEAALAVGARCAGEGMDRGARLLIAGDMGIGNTTAAACLICALTGATAAEVVGRGTGIDDAALVRKRRIVDAAVTRSKRGERTDPRTVLATLGGFELAAMAGFYLEGVRRRAPMLLDGFVASAAALVAQAIDDRLREWLLATHVSAEQGASLALRALGLAPLFDLRLRLGEGTGATLALPIIRAALALHREMATFDEAGVSDPSAPTVRAARAARA
jgi:nicotinate-nucleotide--dimethylbenzimidazole phosphoribosyltransferase